MTMPEFQHHDWRESFHGHETPPSDGESVWRKCIALWRLPHAVTLLRRMIGVPVATVGLCATAYAQELTVEPAPGVTVQISTHALPATDWHVVRAHATIRWPGRVVESSGAVSGFRCGDAPGTVAGRLIVPVVVHNDLSGIIALDIEPDCSRRQRVRATLNRNRSSEEILGLLSDSNITPFTYNLRMEHAEGAEIWLVRFEQAEFLFTSLDQLMAFISFRQRLQHVGQQLRRHASSTVSAATSAPIHRVNTVDIPASGDASVTVYDVSAAGWSLRSWVSQFGDADAPRNCLTWYELLLSLVNGELPLCLAANALDYLRDNFEPVIPRQVVVATCRYHPEEAFVVGELNGLSALTQVTCPVDGCSAIDHASFSFH